MVCYYPPVHCASQLPDYRIDWVVANGEASNLVENESIMRMKADGFYNLMTGECVASETFAAQNGQVNAVCGIGNPGRFFQSLHELGINTIKHIYSDHYDFAGEEVRFGDGLPVVCTEKDAAKLKHLEGDFLQVWYLRVSVQMQDDASERLLSLLTERAIAPRRELDLGESDDLVELGEEDVQVEQDA